MLHNANRKVDTVAIRITPLEVYERSSSFLKRIIAYYKKEENPILFSERIRCESLPQLRKRKYADTLAEEDPEKVKRIIIEADLVRFILSYLNIRSYLDIEKFPNIVRG
ncbi:hypothetical protein CC78DRAFT_483252 [Lojkania enalia]|uniref:Uncharacterized protein n=1 Tax=Lojkania enalia TaxID=147567 RepID=A0A9P4JZV6_9PLEO|nr:hypothetical protein CC78DRAFT_483252 [Didymosphaeria enalia]